MPPVKGSNRKGEKLDWQKIDKKLARKVKNVCDEIMSSKSFPVRVSITEIIRRVDKKTWIEKRARKLPLTNKIINERLESLEDYMIRKVRWAMKEFLKEKKLPTKERLKMIAVVRNKTSDESKKVQKAIIKTIEEINKLIV